MLVRRYITQMSCGIDIDATMMDRIRQLSPPVSALGSTYTLHNYNGPI